MSTASLPERVLRLARIDLAPRHRQPSNGAVVLATAVALAGSLAVDALLVGLGTSLFPSTKGFAHFRFSDYATLTVIGVLIACAGWPVVTRVSSAPRWLYLRLAVAVTLVLWLPDVWILLRGEPARAVAVLMVMHLAIAIVTYNAVVRIAPVRPLRKLAATPDAAGNADGGSMDWMATPASNGHGRGGSAPVLATTARSLSRLTTPLAVLVLIEFLVGIVALVAVPARRPTAVVPARGEAVYLLHALLGLPLALGAVVVLQRTISATRNLRIVGWAGFAGVATAGVGGLLTVLHPVRVLGIAFMFVGSAIAGFAYLIPVLDERDVAPPPRA